MEEQKKYYIRQGETLVEVSKEVYEAYYTGKRKEKYFAEDLKRRRNIKSKTGEIVTIPARESSFEQMLESHYKFQQQADVEDQVFEHIQQEQIHHALHMLPPEEKKLIEEIYINGRNDSAVAQELGISKSTLSYRKKKILSRLREILQNL